MVDLEAWQLIRQGQVVHVEPTVLKLLVFLIENRHRLVIKRELLDAVWGGTYVSESALSKAVARLRKALEDTPSKPKYIETVHALGYRFTADIQVIEQPTGNKSIQASTRRRTFTRILFAGILIIVLLLLSLELSNLWMEKSSKEEPLKVTSLAVLPLSNLSGDQEQDYLVDGLHEALITELSKIAGLKVISRQSSMHYKTSDKLVPEIATELNVDALVEGGVLRVGDEVQVTAQLIHGLTDEHMWAETYRRDLRDVFTLLSEVARAITEEIEITLMPEEEQRLSRTAPVNPEANDAYLRGRHFLNSFTPEGFQKALVYFNQAVDIDPNFALGWASLAGTQLLIAYFGDMPPHEAIFQARVAALRALELDNQLSGAYAALGWVRLYTWDWPGAGEAFERALRLNPNDAVSYHGYADYLTLTGQPEEGLLQVKRGRSIDPFTPMSNLPVPFHLYLMRRYDESISEVHELLKVNPGYPVNWLLTQVYWQKGMFTQALVEYRKALVRWNDSELLEAMEDGNVDSGPRGAMLAVARKLDERSKLRYVDPFRVASMYAMAGEVDCSFEWLESAINQGSLELVYIDVRPDFDPLRHDQRYGKLMNRLGLSNP